MAAQLRLTGQATEEEAQGFMEDGPFSESEEVFKELLGPEEVIAPSTIGSQRHHQEPRERHEAVFGSEDDGFVTSSASSTTPPPVGHRRANYDDTGRDDRLSETSTHVSSTVVGKGDIELHDLEAGRAVQQPERPKKELYRVWPSRNKFFCRGLLMTGGETELGITPNWSVPNLCVWTCILAPCSLYFFWVFPHLWQQGIYAMPAATVAVFFMASGFLLATCCSDPGIIPRREVILATDSSDRLEATLGYDPLVSGYVAQDGRNGALNIPPELQSRNYRWCRTCRIVRPPRSSHCPDCDNCVLRYDHHCPFVNNCIGQRNYHFFFGFVTSVLCLAMLVLPVLFWFLNSDDFEQAVEAMTHVSTGVLQPVFYMLIACGSLIGIAALLSLLLWFYHLFLIATRRTTKEFRRNIENITEEPTLCATRGPRLFDPWALIDPRDLIRHDETPPPPPPYYCSACYGDDAD